MMAWENLLADATIKQKLILGGKTVNKAKVAYTGYHF